MVRRYEEGIQRLYSENLKGRGNFGDLSLDERMLKWSSEKYGVKVWSGFTGFSIESGGDFLCSR